MSRKEPLVSVVLPVYNRPEVKKTIESIIGQTYQNLEIIIIDNASTDNTAQVIRKIKDSRIRLVINEKNMGQTFSMNRGLELSKGKYVARIDSDDIALPDRIAKQAAYMEEHKECVICGSWVQVISDEGEKSYILKNCETDRGIRISQIFRCSFWHPSVMIRNDILKRKKIVYDEKLKISEDYDMWRRLLKYGKGHNLGEVLTYYRRGRNNDSKKYLDIMWRESQEIKKKERLDLKNAYWKKILLEELDMENKDRISLSDIAKIYVIYKKFISAVYRGKDSDFEILNYHLKVEVFSIFTNRNDGLSASFLMLIYHMLKRLIEGFMRYDRQKAH